MITTNGLTQYNFCSLVDVAATIHRRHKKVGRTSHLNSSTSLVLFWCVWLIFTATISNNPRQGGYFFARLFVCLSVHQQDNSKSYGRIFMKFSGNVGNGKNYQWFNFGGWSGRNPGFWITLKFSLPLLSMGHKGNHWQTEDGAVTWRTT